MAADPLALGFASIGYDEGVRYLGLRLQRTGRAAFPSLEEIESERYGLAKVIYVYFTESGSSVARQVVDYLQSAEGRAAIESTDLWPMPAGAGGHAVAAMNSELRIRRLRGASTRESRCACGSSMLPPAAILPTR